MTSPLNVLIAFPYFQCRPSWADFLRTIPHDDYRLIVDSGAFSAWSSGQVIKMDDYCEFLNSVEDLRPFNAVQLDVFSNPEASYKNFIEMRDRGFQVMPVFTRGESTERLEEFYKLTDYIMFGGIATGGKNNNYVKWFQQHNGKRKVHWLGFTSLPYIKYYRPESVDSSSWCNSLRYGNMWVYNGRLKLTQSTRADFTKRPDPELIKKLKAVGAEDYHIRNLAFEDSWRYTDSSEIPGPDQRKSTTWFLSTMAFLKQAIEIERQLGTKVYMAVSIPSKALEFIFQCYYYGKDKGVW